MKSIGDACPSLTRSGQYKWLMSNTGKLVPNTRRHGRVARRVAAQQPQVQSDGERFHQVARSIAGSGCNAWGQRVESNCTRSEKLIIRGELVPGVLRDIDLVRY
ncbi:hypothetical protein MRX96_030907 [Rhipicephalus microplus]